MVPQPIVELGGGCLVHFEKVLSFVILTGADRVSSTQARCANLLRASPKSKVLLLHEKGEHIATRVA